METCSAASATLLAAIDSSPAEVNHLAERHGLDVDNREGLDSAGSYVAICAYDASEIAALADGLSVFGLWESDGFGNGVIAVW